MLIQLYKVRVREPAFYSAYRHLALAAFCGMFQCLPWLTACQASTMDPGVSQPGEHCSGIAY